jgi:putative FmdB family regulatory protein
VPTYSYACKQCGYSFDQQQDFSDPALTTCPHCQGALRKLFGRVGVVFKGSGFYRTDSRQDAGRPGGKSVGHGDTTATPKPVTAGSSSEASSSAGSSGCCGGGACGSAAGGQPAKAAKQPATAGAAG